MALSKSLDKLTKDMQKKFKSEDIVTVAALSDHMVVPSHSTGSMMFDLALGSGPRAGLPEGRFVEIYGPESAGKTTVCMLAIAARQQEENLRAAQDPNYQKKYCLYLDAEHSFDMKLAAEYGVDLEELLFINPVTSEDAMDIFDAYVRGGEIGLAVIDSVPALVPSAMDNASYNQQFMGLVARMMSRICQQESGPVHKHGTTVIFINQIREKIGVMFGNPETTPGGKALKYYSSMRIVVRAGDKIKDGDDVLGHMLKIKIVKNKLSKPFKQAEVRLIYGQGVDRIDELASVALKAGIVKQAGAWFSYTTEDGELVNYNGIDMKFNGRAKLLDALHANPMFAMELEDRLRGVVVEGDDMDPEEIAAIEAQKHLEETNASQAADKAIGKNKKAAEAKYGNNHTDSTNG